MGKDLGTKRKSNNQSLVYIYLKPYMAGLILATVLAIILGLVSALVGAFVGPCLQIIAAPRDAFLTFDALLGPRLGALFGGALGRDGVVAGDLLVQLPLALFILAAIKGGLTIWQWFLWERASERVAQRMRSDLFRGYLNIDPSQRRSDQAREVEATLSSAVTTDVKMLREYIVRYHGGLPRELLQVVFLGVTLVLLSPKMFGIFVLGVLPALAFASRLGRKLRRRAAKALEDYSSLTEWLQQRLLGIETIKHYRTEGIEAQNMEELTSNLNKRFLRASRVKARTSPILEALAAFSMVIVLLIAIKDVQSGAASGAIQLSFFSTLALLSQAAAKLGRYFNADKEGTAATDRLQTLIDSLNGQQNKEANDWVVKLPAGQPAALSFEKVTASYPGQPMPALADFSYEFKGGQVYCLAGRSGAGKSTLMNLALGLLKPVSGQVRLLTPSHSSSSWPVAYMPQKIQLVQDTLAANVAYPDPVADTKLAEEALEKVGLGALVRGLPAGLETIMGEGGVGVSGGQAQRILLARLWYHKQPFVLVDEGTSALDPEIEQFIYKLLRELAAAGSVVLTIAHRVSATSMADVVLILERGCLKFSGKPQAGMLDL